MMRTHRTWVIGFGMLACVVADAMPGWAAPLRVDGFEDSSFRNLLGYETGAWNRYPEDETQGCVAVREEAAGYGGTGAALRIEYDVDSPNPAFCGFWSALGGLDLRPYHQLVLYVKGDPVKGYTTQVKVELKPTLQPSSQGPPPPPDAETEEVRPRYLLKGITDQWQRFVIPLDAFKELTDRSSVKELVMIFDDMTSTKKRGAIYLDDIAFE